MVRHFPLTRIETISSAATRWLAGERWDEAVPRQASTVMLVREGSAGGQVEVFVLRRVSQMAFAPSTYVFPGGGVDERDGDADLPWAGPAPSEWARRLGCDESTARLLVAAAVRELLEECGVLLAGASVDGPLVRADGDEWRAVRDGLLSRELSLTGVLRERGLVVRSDLLVAKAHWLTPAFEPRRFDTWFFAAVMPTEQVADGDTSEADHAAWVDPAALLDAYAAGSAAMLPPTVVCLEEIRQASNVAEFVTHRESLPLVMPVVVDTPDGPAMEVVV